MSSQWDSFQVIHRATWVNGDKRMDGQWYYDESARRYVITLDAPYSAPSLLPGGASKVTVPDKPEWDNWRIVGQPGKSEESQPSRHPRKPDVISGPVDVKYELGDVIKPVSLPAHYCSEKLISVMDLRNALESLRTTDPKLASMVRENYAQNFLEHHDYHVVCIVSFLNSMLRETPFAIGVTLLNGKMAGICIRERASIIKEEETSDESN